MEHLNPLDLKANIHSKRANVYYLEYCRVMQLRKVGVTTPQMSFSSLPYRQLRKNEGDSGNTGEGSLPCRQLRKRTKS